MADQKQMMIRYLLGELSESESESLERAYFADPNLFDQLVAVENDLVDAFARGRLVDQVQSRFEQYYLRHPDRAERAQFARALIVKTDSDRSSIETIIPKEAWHARLLKSLLAHKSQLAFAAALACLLLIMATAWLVVRTRKSREESAQIPPQQTEKPTPEQQIRAEQNSAKEQQENLAALPSPSPAHTQSRTVKSTVTLALTIADTRAPQTGLQILLLPTGTQQIDIQITIKDSDYLNYEVIVQPVSRNPILNRKGLKAVQGKHGASIELSLPPSILSPGDYMLTVRGVPKAGEAEDISKSLFRVVKN